MAQIWKLMSFIASNLGQICSGAQNIALDPIKNTIYYFVPFFGAMSSKYTPIAPNDASSLHIISDVAKDRILNEVECIRKCANLYRKVQVYTALNVSPLSYGGSLSLTQPLIVIPYENLFRPTGSSFGEEKFEEGLAKNIHVFSDDETRFFIAREMGHLKFNDAIFKTAAKVMLIAAALILCTTPLGWLGTAAIVGGAFMIYLIADRVYESKIDIFAAKTVALAIGDDRRAVSAALNALKKWRAQNLERREKNLLNRLYLTQAGNNLFDFKNPLLSSRILAMQKCLDGLETTKNRFEPAAVSLAH